jgi:ribosomal-protein-alanine N-acetyltransferase
VLTPLTTEHLVLRPYVPADHTDVARLLADPVIMAYVFGGPKEGAAAEAFVHEQLEAEQAFPLGVLVLREGGAFVGLSGAHPCPPLPGLEIGPGDLEIGFVLTKDYHGRGYATEIGRRLIDQVLVDLARPRALALCHPENHASIGVVERRLGMRFLDEVREVTAERGPRRVYALP